MLSAYGGANPSLPIMSDHKTDVQRVMNMVYHTCGCDEEKGLKVMLKAMEKSIEKAWGKKCPDFEKDCGCCEVWKKFETFKKFAIQ